jgi:hypothetical protein
LPSVDKEKDETFSSQSFWNVTDVNQLNQDARLNATITELILFDPSIQDGTYLLNIQIASSKMRVQVSLFVCRY